MNDITASMADDDVADRYRSVIHQLVESGEKLYTKLDKLQGTIQALDNAITKLTISLQLQHTAQTPVLLNDLKEYPTGNAAAKGIRMAYEREDKPPAEGKHEHASVYTVADNTVKLMKNTADMINAFEAVPEATQKTIKTLSAVSEGAKGIGELVAGLGKEVSTSATLAAGAEIMAGAAGIAEAGAFFGPVGWIVGAGALAVGATAMYLMNENEQQKDTPRETVGAVKSQLWAEEKQKDRERLIALYNVTNLKQMDDVEQELDMDYMAQDRMKRVDEALRNRQTDYSAERTKWIDPAIKARETENRLTWHTVAPTNVPKEKQVANGVEHIWETARLNSLFGVPMDIDRINEQVAAYKSNAAGAPEPLYRLPGEADWNGYNRKRLGLPQLPAKQETRYATNGNTVAATQAQAAGRVIHINLNKPMIEHFTINTATPEEGVKDLKRKVEAILLEILNSANLI